jgi:hypothetical protein
LASNAALLVIKIPTNDVYGLTNAINKMTTDGTKINEIYTSHSMLPDCDLHDNLLSNGLRCSATGKDVDNFTKLYNELQKIKK